MSFWCYVFCLHKYCYNTAPAQGPETNGLYVPPMELSRKELHKKTLPAPFANALVLSDGSAMPTAQVHSFLLQQETIAKIINSNEGSWRPKTKHTSQMVHRYCNKRWTLRIHCTLKLFICQWNEASTLMEANSDRKTYNVLALFVGLTRKTDCKHNRHVH